MALIQISNDIISVARVTSPPDPAWDTKVDGWVKLALDYERTRSEEHLAALPCKPGQKPVMFHLRDLTPAEVRLCMSSTNDYARQEMAALCGVVRIVDGMKELTPKTISGDGYAYAESSWLTNLWRYGKAQGVKELGTLVLKRAEGADGESVPFQRALGTQLAL